MICAACNTDASALFRNGYNTANLCSRCWSGLPYVTRSAWQSGTVAHKEIVHAAMERRTSLKTIGGGRHTKPVPKPKPSRGRR